MQTKQVEKKKRIKKVFSSSSEVLHMWAAQTQSDARQGGNRSRCFFEGTSCYSYGHHYELGRLVKINGIQVALINTTGYSHTTSSHISYAKSAVSHMPIIDVDDSFDWKQGLLTMQDKLVDAFFDRLNQNKFYSGYCVWEKYNRKGYSEFNELCSTVGMPQLELNPDDESIQVIEDHVKTRQARQKELDAIRHNPEYLAKQEKKEIAAANRLAAKSAAEIEAWKLGGPNTNNVKGLEPQIIRVNGDRVETSRQASVTLPEARRALMLLENSQLESNSQIGNYTFNKVENGLVKIGCHTIDLMQAKQVLNVSINSKRKAANET